jgi:precorrin-4/cobalt-precorrin-4 C11-methyltransferase
MKVIFLGAGPGDPELLTLKAKRVLEDAAVVLYAGSLVNPQVLSWAPADAQIYDTSAMNLDEIGAVFIRTANQPGVIARVHTGDPSLYGAIAEQILICRDHGIEWEVIPGVSSFFAAAAALGQELTLPGVSQTVIITRAAGRTPVPDRESLQELARSRATMVLFLSSGLVEHAMQQIEPHYGGETPVAVVYRAGWPDQRIVEGTVTSIARRMQDAGINRQAIIIIGDVVRAERFANSKLYDAGFAHGYRGTSKSPSVPGSSSEPDNSEGVGS